MDKIVILDAGHGKDTPGKCSPDKSFYEWEWTRRAAELLELSLKLKGYTVHRIYPDIYEDFKSGKYITNRIIKANSIVKDHPNASIILISMHNNAAGDGSDWTAASGFSAFVAPNSSSASKRLAGLLIDEAAQVGLKGNRSIPVQKYWTGNFGILTKTKCPAVLTENLFMDNKDDVKYLKSDKGLNELVKVHIRAIERYFK